MVRSQIFFALIALLVTTCGAQLEGWKPGQVDATMCQWRLPRAGVVQDAVYLDGGDVYWRQGMDDDKWSLWIDANPQKLIYYLHFGSPFRTTPDFNQSTLFNTKEKVDARTARNIPNYYDGAMFANDFEWVTYAGIPKGPVLDTVAYFGYYTLFLHIGQTIETGFAQQELPPGITSYVTYGAAVSVPSENLGFYFGGLKSETGGQISYLPPPENKSQNPDHLSSRLISVDLSAPNLDQWTDDALAESIPGRANAELVWVPVSEKGILVGIGGVTHPSYANIPTENNTASEDAASSKESPLFMSSVAVYDIANKRWYEQNTTGAPPPALAQGCAVVASAEDGSSHNIYWYGGYDGLHPSGDFNDDVWILSVPSFTWFHFKSGNPTHARAGHRCVKPYPDQMFVIGGYTPDPAITAETKCLDGGIIQVLNLTSGEWLPSYDPDVWRPYQVPEVVFAKIGGNGAGNATLLSPSTAVPNMTTLLHSAYNTAKVKTHYPYLRATQTSSSSPTATLPPPVSVKSGTPAYLAPVLGVVLGLFFLILLILGALLWRRRKILRLNGTATQSDSGTMDIRTRVASWIRGTPTDAKAPTVTTDDTPITTSKYTLPYDVSEAGGVQVHELMDTSRPFELHDTGFVPMSQVPPLELPTRASDAPRQRPVISTVIPRADSPTTAHDRSPIPSVSSEFNNGHLRAISETSVSTVGNRASLAETGLIPQSPDPGRRAGAVSPLTPSDMISAVDRGYADGGDTQVAQSPTISTRRRSNFSEELDEPGGRSPR